MYQFGRRIPLLAISISLCLLAGNSRSFADEAIQLSPFQRMVRGLNPANWKVPGWNALLPQNEEKARIKKKKDGLVEEVSKTASTSWNRTKQALNPVKFFTASSRSATPPTDAEAKRSGFFQWLFTPSPPPDEDSSVSDFLKQSRPSP